MPRTDPIKAVRGVRDILPREIPYWREAEKAARDVAQRFGYDEIVTPIIEHAELIERAGEDTDAFAKELYKFEDRGGRKLALRPEATAGVVRAYFEHGLNQGPQPSRLYLIGPMFRYDRPQKGRYRQFFQLDLEVIGSASAALDAEVIEVARNWLRQVRLGDLRIELNTIGDSRCRPAYLELLKDYYRPLKLKLSPDSQQRLERNPLRLLDSKSEQDVPFRSNAPRITDHLCADCAAHWALVRRLLDSAGIEYVLNPYLVRGLDYYTRTVFELFPSGSSGQQDALGGGGRYDGLAEAEGWPATSAVGFASGLDRVTELMEAGDKRVGGQPAADVLVLPDGDLVMEAAEVARICRTVRSTVVDYESGKFTSKWRLAEKVGARWVVLMRPAEAAKRTARLREVASRTDMAVSWEDLPGKLA
ncbi:MAG TPA: histidine--tRNA ligase [Candidatus Dormibacteraeota bacterium]|nr:histidine--tRNA ligase [Candidatus Dormibacteraeota bacterium]